ncbi:MAG: Rieske 2Fe-2S domain-containing protein [Ginsengibacter sp.]|jgi:3-phenylpropionate/trans-cinnamate dioxygenase ferredoxin subunit
MNIERKYKWIKVANHIKELNFNENNLIEIEIEEKKICIANTAFGLRACTSKCPHAGGNISQGKLDSKQNITCTVHNYQFNLINGRDTNNEGYFLKLYPMQQTENGVFVGIEEV